MQAEILSISQPVLRHTISFTGLDWPVTVLTSWDLFCVTIEDKYTWKHRCVSSVITVLVCVYKPNTEKKTAFNMEVRLHTFPNTETIVKSLIFKYQYCFLNLDYLSKCLSHSPIVSRDICTWWNLKRLAKWALKGIPHDYFCLFVTLY